MCSSVFMCESVIVMCMCIKLVNVHNVSLPLIGRSNLQSFGNDLTLLSVLLCYIFHMHL